MKSEFSYNYDEHMLITDNKWARSEQAFTMRNSKWVWSGNTTITNRRHPRGTARKSRSTIARHQKNKISKATSPPPPLHPRWLQYQNGHKVTYNKTQNNYRTLFCKAVYFAVLSMCGLHLNYSDFTLYTLSTDISWPRSLTNVTALCPWARPIHPC